MKNEEKKGEKKGEKWHRSGLNVRTASRRVVHDPLTPEGGKPRKRHWRDSDCWSPTVLERKPSLTTQVVPQICADVVEEERVVSQDDDPHTPRGQMIKVPTEPPPLKAVLPLPGNETLPAADSIRRDSSPCLLSSGLCGWL